VGDNNIATDSGNGSNHGINFPSWSTDTPQLSLKFTKLFRSCIIKWEDGEHA
jgi:hypothetical protein